MEEGNYRDEIYSESIRAGKRTYFFDVKATRGNDLYLTITESKKRFKDDGTHFYEKHKLFLYKEDFEKFSEGLKAAIDKIEELKKSGDYVSEDSSQNHTLRAEDNTSSDNDDFTNIKFEDLDK